MSSPLRYDAANPSDSAALEAFFARCDVPCHCRYWHFAGDKNAWLDRCFNAPSENARELREDLERSGELSAVVARDDHGIHGWLKITPAERVEKLYQQRLYRGLPCFAGERSGTFTVGCVLVEPDFRRRGVARELLSAAVDLAKQAGARRIEAFPRRGEHLGDPELWMGPYSSFERAGFRVVNEFAPYPVLRLEL
ncbi:MAG: GNAT family N-acetyltransferase [Myxococcota bacterium]